MVESMQAVMLDHARQKEQCDQLLESFFERIKDFYVRMAEQQVDSLRRVFEERSCFKHFEDIFDDLHDALNVDEEAISSATRKSIADVVFNLQSYFFESNYSKRNHAKTLEAALDKFSNEFEFEASSQLRASKSRHLKAFEKALPIPKPAKRPEFAKYNAATSNCLTVTVNPTDPSDLILESSLVPSEQALVKVMNSVFVQRNNVLSEPGSVQYLVDRLGESTPAFGIKSMQLKTVSRLRKYVCFTGIAPEEAFFDSFQSERPAHDQKAIFIGRYTELEALEKFGRHAIAETEQVSTAKFVSDNEVCLAQLQDSVLIIQIAEAQGRVTLDPEWAVGMNSGLCVRLSGHVGYDLVELDPARYFKFKHAKTGNSAKFKCNVLEVFPVDSDRLFYVNGKYQLVYFNRVTMVNRKLEGSLAEFEHLFPVKRMRESDIKHKESTSKKIKKKLKLFKSIFRKTEKQEQNADQDRAPEFTFKERPLEFIRHKIEKHKLFSSKSQEPARSERATGKSHFVFQVIDGRGFLTARSILEGDRQKRVFCVTFPPANQSASAEQEFTFNFYQLPDSVSIHPNFKFGGSHYKLEKLPSQSKSLFQIFFGNLFSSN